MQVRVIARLAPKDLQGAIGDDLIGVHVDRSPAGSLQHTHDELIMMPARHQLIAGRDDGAGQFGTQRPDVTICQRRRFLDRGERIHKPWMSTDPVTAKRRVFHPAQSVDAI